MNYRETDHTAALHALTERVEKLENEPRCGTLVHRGGRAVPVAGRFWSRLAWAWVGFSAVGGFVTAWTLAIVYGTAWAIGLAVFAQLCTVVGAIGYLTYPGRRDA
jgi:hypothetical protein